MQFYLSEGNFTAILYYLLNYLLNYLYYQQCIFIYFLQYGEDDKNNAFKDINPFNIIQTAAHMKKEAAREENDDYKKKMKLLLSSLRLFEILLLQSNTSNVIKNAVKKISILELQAEIQSLQSM